MKNNINKINRPVLFALWLVILMSISSAARTQGAGQILTMYVGDTQTLDLGAIKRVAVGQGSIVSSSILEGGQLLLLAEAAGETEMSVWLDDGDVYEYKIRVNEVDLGRVSNEVRQLLNSLPNVSQRRVGKRVVLEGAVDAEGKAMLEIVAGLYADNIVDLTEVSQVGSQKMIYMNVQITEFNTNKLRSLGINWQNSFNGPSLGYTRESVFNDAGELSVLNSLPDGVSLGLPDGRQNVSVDDFGYFGIATQILSTINLARNNGDAIILAEPSLSARSGGEAEFLSGGEVPLPVVSNDGQASVEFKEFGIKLRIKPQADDAGNVVAEVETELSTVDSSLAVNGIPGFRTRKASTDASLKHGETLVISGLVNKELSDNTTGLAGLSQIPILGALFRSSDFRNSKSELVIFVTPYIFDEQSEVNKKSIQRAQDLRAEFLENINKPGDILD